MSTDPQIILLDIAIFLLGWWLIPWKRLFPYNLVIYRDDFGWHWRLERND
jgi:hypothetical protein